MLNLKKSIYMFMVVCIFSFTGNSQAPRGTAEQQRQDEINRQNRERDLDDRSNNLHGLMNDSLSQHQDKLNEDHSPKIKPLTKKEKARISKILTPNAEDLVKYKDFLQQKNTGLFRLFPDIGCESENIIRTDGDCENFVSGSWAYSFRLKNHVKADFSDIRFSEKYLISDRVFSHREFWFR